MTFLKHTAKATRFRTASSRTLGGQVGLAARVERRLVVPQRLHQVAPAAALPGENTPRSFIAGDPRWGSGPYS